MEAERQARVEELLIRRKEQEARIELQRQEKEKAREDAARERARFVAKAYKINHKKEKLFNTLR